MTAAAITIRQPWAYAITCGKNVENRSRPTSYRGPVAIHAGKTLDRDAMHDYRVVAAGARDRVGALVFGAVIAVADLVDCHLADTCTREGCRVWGDPTGYHLVLADVVALPAPVPARGALGLPWRLPLDVSSAVTAHLGGGW